MTMATFRLKPRHLKQELMYASGETPRTLKGARQFWQFESTKEEPPHGEGEPYYHDLRRGKMDRCLSLTHMADSYEANSNDAEVGGWFGWMYINLAFDAKFIEDLKSALRQRGWDTDKMNTAGGLSSEERQCAQEKHAAGKERLVAGLTNGRRGQPS